MKYLPAFGLCLLFLACNSAKKSFDKQNFDKAYRISLKELQKGKNNKESKSILRRSLTAITKRDMAEIKQLDESEKVKDWEKALKMTIKLQDKIEAGKPYLFDYFETERRDLAAAEGPLATRISDTHYQNGIDKLESAISSDSKRPAQIAYQDFIQAEKYARVELNLDSLKDQAVQQGRMRYNVEANMTFGISYEWEIDRVFRDISGQSSLFHQITYESYGQTIDCNIEVAFRKPDIDYRDREQEEDFSERIITGYNTTIDTAGNETEEPIYETVTGSVITQTRVRSILLNASVNINPHSKHCYISATNFNATNESEIRTTSIQGDERAIPDEYLRGNNEEFEDEDDIVEELIQDIYGQFVNNYF